MKLLILLAFITLGISASQLFKEITADSQIKEPNEGVIECIINRNPNIQDAVIFCGPPIADNIDCLGSFASLELCLLNNNCQNSPKDLAVNI